MARKQVHLLRENGAKQAPFADFTYCGIDLRILEATPAYYPGEGLHANERWCPMCRERLRAAS